MYTLILFHIENFLFILSPNSHSPYPSPHQILPHSLTPLHSLTPHSPSLPHTPSPPHSPHTPPLIPSSLSPHSPRPPPHSPLTPPLTLPLTPPLTLPLTPPHSPHSVTRTSIDRFSSNLLYCSNVCGSILIGGIASSPSPSSHCLLS